MTSAVKIGPNGADTEHAKAKTLKSTETKAAPTGVPPRFPHGGSLRADRVKRVPRFRAGGGEVFGDA
jgi:hypothetical protein